MQFLSIHPFLCFSQTFHHEIQDDSQQEPPDEIEDSGLDIGRDECPSAHRVMDGQGIAGIKGKIETISLSH
jgi:hypothetical protein